MCRYVTVFTTGYGEVRRCLDCGGLRLRAGTLVVPLQVEDLRWLDQTAERLDSRAPRAGLSDAEHFLLHFDASGIALAVSGEQVEPLRQLLAGARLFLTLDGRWPAVRADGESGSTTGRPASPP
jgi:hypothetical protein